MMRIVLDANVVAALVLPLPYSDQATQRMIGWQGTGTGLFAPTLLEYELVTVLRKALVTGMITADEASLATKDLMDLNIEAVPPTLSLHESALRWADRLDQSVAYDAQYLALAEHLGAEFWTADQRLVNKARQVGATWAHWIAEDLDT
jgi:predicted nucleic acid-binding protein